MGIHLVSLCETPDVFPYKTISIPREIMNKIDCRKKTNHANFGQLVQKTSKY